MERKWKMDDIMVIAQNTASRVLRMKAVYFLLACAICIVATGQLYKDITAGQEKAYTMDLGFFMATVVGVLCALVACFDLPRERREKTMVAMLSKPLGRDRYLMGKFIGTIEIAVVCMAIMCVALIILAGQAGIEKPGVEIIKAVMILVSGVIQLAAVGILLGTFMKEWLATVMTLLIFWLVFAMGGLAVSATGITKTLLLLLPNFAVMSVTGLVVRGVEIDWTFVIHSLVMAVVYSLALMVIAGFIFKRKDIA